MAQYFVYILASKSKVLYTGVTNNLARRLSQHQEQQGSGFTARYRVRRLVYYETTDSVRAAIFREKQIKGWLRSKKVALIESVNLDWRDLSQDR